MRAPAPRRRPGPVHLALIAGSVIALLVAVGLGGDRSALLAVAGLAGLVTGVIVLVRGIRRGTREKGGRGSLAIVAVGAAGLFLGGTAFASPADTGMPSASPSAAVVAGRLTATRAASASVAPAASAAPLTGARALRVLAVLPVKGSAPMTGYTRAEFGTAWFDADRNGCDTRNDVLHRDLVDRVQSRCRVLSGLLRDPYTKQDIRFTRGQGTSEAVQIDHLVPLADAWRTGAQQLPATVRRALANDPANLLAVDGPTNTAKSDGDAATWLPKNKAYRCEYVAHQVAVKRAYHLWVTPAEHDAIARVLRACPAQRTPAVVLAKTAFASSGAVTPAPTSTPAPSATPTRSAAPTAAPVAAVVHPGSYCSDAGATGRTSAGTLMRCTTTATDARLRWRSA